jgi:hypothetical protein
MINNNNNLLLFIYLAGCTMFTHLSAPISPRGGPKLVLVPCSLILAYQGLEEENLDQILPGPPCWGLVQQASSLLIEKKTC